MRISSQPGDQLITYALGSCLGIAIHDPVACVGGLLHIMLPTSTIDPAKAEDNPCMFVDTGVPKLFLDCYAAGASKDRLILKVAGGASTSCGGEDYFQIGRRNLNMLRQLLSKNNVWVSATDVGGRQSRTMSLDIGTGEVTIKSNGTITVL